MFDLQRYFIYVPCSDDGCKNICKYNEIILKAFIKTIQTTLGSSTSSFRLLLSQRMCIPFYQYLSSTLQIFAAISSKSLQESTCSILQMELYLHPTFLTILQSI